MDKNPLVSIIIITYNSSKYVLETLESAKAQTYQNIELIISDDASHDDTVQICRDWLEKNKERFVRTELVTVDKNTGIPANCNRGLKVSKGEWVKLIAGDDALLSDCILNNIKYTNGNQHIEVLFSVQNQYRNTFEAAHFFGNAPLVEDDMTSFFSLEAGKQYDKLLLGDEIYFTPTFFVRRQTLFEVGLYDEEFRHIEDYPMWLRLTKNGYQLHFMNLVTVNYRLHDSSIYGSTAKKLVPDALFKHSKLRKKYVYPNITLLFLLDYKYRISISYLLKIFTFNRGNHYTRFILRILKTEINPINWLIILLNPSVIKNA